MSYSKKKYNFKRLSPPYWWRLRENSIEEYKSIYIYTIFVVFLTRVLYVCLVSCFTYFLSIENKKKGGHFITSMIDTKKFGGVLKASGLNQKELAALIGVTPCTISNIMHGRTKPGYEFTNACYYVLGMSSEDFVAVFYKVNLNEEYAKQFSSY